VQAARGLLGWTRAQLSSECGLSERSLWNIEKGLTARPYAKTQTAICTAFEVAGIGFTINDPPILRSKKGAGWIGPAITTKFAVGDDVHFHPIAGDLIAAASGSYVDSFPTPSNGMLWPGQLVSLLMMSWNVADVTFNQALGINSSGMIAGYFGSGAAASRRWPRSPDRRRTRSSGWRAG
jgi:transcriptional regulator with XRE-family HTH domain